MEKTPKAAFLSALLFVVLFAVETAFAQTSNGTVGGIVQDNSRALIPGVSVTLANTGTGVKTLQVTNETGAYTFLGVPPGTYSVTAELPGFKTTVHDGVQVGTAAQIRIDFTLEVGRRDETVEVTATADAALTDSSATVGDVLQEHRSATSRSSATTFWTFSRSCPDYD